jgi:hypothetical protein
VAPILCACSPDDASSPLTPLPPVAIRTIQALSHNPLGAIVQHDSDRDRIRVRYVASDLSDIGFTPWQGSDSSVVVLGLGPALTYALNVQSSFDGRVIDGPPSDYRVPPIPSSLAQVTLGLQAPFSGGYSMAPIAGLDGHGYLIIFDSLGTIRWYRDFGTQVVFATTQQENGRITAFVGKSNGFNAASGAYVEVSAAGDSVRSVTAVGSSYTDPHELLESFDRRGNRRADFLFGYGFRTLDRTAIGGGPADTVAVHQVL